MVLINCHLCCSDIPFKYRDVQKHYKSAHNLHVTHSAWESFSNKFKIVVAPRPVAKLTKSQRGVARKIPNKNQKKGMLTKLEVPKQESTALKVEEPMSYQELEEIEREFDKHQPKMPENQNMTTESGNTVQISDSQNLTQEGTNAATRKENDVPEKKNTKGMYDEGCFNCRRDHTKCMKLHKFRCTREGCNYVANAKSKFDDHVKRKHDKIRDLPCPKCDFMDSDATNLKRHIKKHGTDHQYKCAVCPKRYSTFLKQSWERHEVSKEHQVNMNAAQMQIMRNVARVAIDKKLNDAITAQGINPNATWFNIVRHDRGSSATLITPPRSPSNEEFVFQRSDETYPEQQSNNTPASLITPPAYASPPELPQVTADFINQAKLGHFMNMEL